MVVVGCMVRAVVVEVAVPVGFIMKNGFQGGFGIIAFCIV